MMSKYPASDVQHMQMVSEALRPVIAYSLPLGLFKQADLDKFASLMTRRAKEACGLVWGTRTGWALLDRSFGGLGAVDIQETAGVCNTERIINDLQDGGSLGRMARGMLYALTDPHRYRKRKSEGGVYFHQLYQMVGLVGSGFELEGTFEDMYQGRVIKGTSSDMEITFGQGFGRGGMEEYMPLWFELGIPGPGTLVAPVRIGKEKGVRRLITALNFQKEHGSVGRWVGKAGGKTTQAQTLALKETVP